MGERTMMATDYLPITVRGLAQALGTLVEHTRTVLAMRREQPTNRFAKVELTVPHELAKDISFPSLESTLSQYMDGELRSYWRTPDSAVRTVAFGSLVSIEEQGQPDFASIREDWETAHGSRGQVVLVQARLDVQKEHGHSGDRLSLNVPKLETRELGDLHWYGGVAFPGSERGAPWLGWPTSLFYLPEFEVVDGEHFLHIYAYLDTQNPKSQDFDRVQSRFLNFIVAPKIDGVKIDGVPNENEEIRDPGEMTQSGQRLYDGDNAENDEPLTFSENEESVWYQEGVKRTASEIRAGQYHKLVLARRLFLTSSVPYDAGVVLDCLRRDYPGSFIFALCYEGACFLGASPERLVRVTEHVASVDCLAGTTARGKTAGEDVRLANELFGSEKNRLEHNVVLEWIRGALADDTVAMDYPEEPQILKLANVQHLHTPIEATLRKGVTILDVAAKLHPTPAVAGTPRDEVVPLIREREKMDRGWYAGCLGVVSGNGDGELCVGIRSAVLTGRHAVLYAGAGIMGDSDPQLEWDETALKLRPMQLSILASRPTMQETTSF